jgi:hypothetical protein
VGYSPRAPGNLSPSVFLRYSVRTRERLDNASLVLDSDGVFPEFRSLIQLGRLFALVCDACSHFARANECCSRQTPVQTGPVVP